LEEAADEVAGEGDSKGFREPAVGVAAVAAGGDKRQKLLGL
jgi:hypothetical protein